jgi:hypothetical protein
MLYNSDPRMFLVSIAVSLSRHWVHLSGLKALTSAYIAIMTRVAIFTTFGVMGIMSVRFLFEQRDFSQEYL